MKWILNKRDMNQIHLAQIGPRSRLKINLLGH